AETLSLYRPVGPKELALIEQSGFSAFPPRLPWQPIFYPVLNEEYAILARASSPASASAPRFSATTRSSRSAGDCIRNTRSPPRTSCCSTPIWLGRLR